MKAQPKASHYINGRFVDDDQGARACRDLSGDRRDDRDAACRDAQHRRAGGGSRARGAAGLGAAEAGRARPHPAPRRRHPARPQRRARAAGDARHRQGDPGDAGRRRRLGRRCARIFRRRGRRLQRRLCRSRRPVRLHAARGARRLRRHRRLELSDPGAPAGNPRRRSPWATPWCSSRPRTRRSRRWRWPRSTPRPACRTACSTSSRALAMSAPRWSSHPAVAKVSLTGSVPTGKQGAGARRLAR